MDEMTRIILTHLIDCRQNSSSFKIFQLDIHRVFTEKNKSCKQESMNRIDANQFMLIFL